MDEFAEPISPNERSKRSVLIGMLVFCTISTLALWVATGNEQVFASVTMFTAIGYAVGALLWCQIDAIDRGIPFGFGFRIFVVLLAAIAVPYYLFKSRGFKEGMMSLGYALVFYLLLVLVSSVTSLLLSIIDGRLTF